MTEEDPSTDGTRDGGPGATETPIGGPVGQSRRRFLHALSGGSAVALAGCGLFQPESSTGTRRGTSTTQTFRAPIGQNPAKTSVYLPHSYVQSLETAFASVVKENAGGRLQRFLREDGVWTDGLWAGADVHYTWLEAPIEITPTEVTITIRDDGRWSDGHRITGTDVALGPLTEHLRKYYPPYYADDEPGDPTDVYGAFDDVEITETSVTYRSSPGHFDAFWDWTIRTELANSFGFTARSLMPTHLEPYEGYANALIEAVTIAQNGDIDPWKNTQPWEQNTAATKQSLLETHFEHTKYVERFANPENVLATGAWDLVEFRGSEAFVFEKNPHHRNADAIDFETLVLEYTASDRRAQAALKANRLDYAAPGATPEAVVDALPATFTQLLIPGSLYSGNELGLDFTHPALETRAVRQAIMFSLDHKVIANNIHQSAAKPVTTPGGDCWDATEYVNQKWIDRNLTTYGTDRDRAASLMREAGYTRDGGQWVDSEGVSLSLTLPTKSNTPRWEQTVANQLTEFGIQTSVQTMSQTDFSNRRNSGAFDIWPTILKSATNLASATLFTWYYAAIQGRTYGIRGVYPEEQFRSGEFSRTGAPVPRTEDRWRAFSIEAPPVGNPDGDLQTYHPSALSLWLFTNPPEPEFRQRIKTGLWLANWFLPTIPINKTMTQQFIDDTHWSWPTGTPSWTAFTAGDPRTATGILASGAIRTNPNTTEQTDIGTNRK